MNLFACFFLIPDMHVIQCRVCIAYLFLSYRLHQALKKVSDAYPTQSFLLLPPLLIGPANGWAVR